MLILYQICQGTSSFCITYHALMQLTGTLNKLAIDEETTNAFKGAFSPSYGCLIIQMITVTEDRIAVGMNPMLNATTVYDMNDSFAMFEQSGMVSSECKFASL